MLLIQLMLNIINLCCFIYPQCRIYYFHSWYFTWRNSSTEKLNNFPKVIQLVKSIVAVWAQISWLVFLPIPLESCLPHLLVLSAFISTKQQLQSLHPGPPLPLPRCRSQTKQKKTNQRCWNEGCLQFYWLAGRGMKGNILDARTIAREDVPSWNRKYYFLKVML